MRTLFYYLTIGSMLLLFGCQKSNDVELIFGETPDDRIAENLSQLKQALTASEHGWIAYTTTEFSGGYGFYIDFDDNDRLRMLADINGTTASEMKESTYRIRQIMSATVSFDTYNYLTMLQDPGPGVMGGLPGRGMGSDVEYEYIHSNADSIILRGRKYDKGMVLVKATAEEKEKFAAGAYATSIDLTKNFFIDNPNSFVEVGGVRYQLSINSTTKSLEGATLLANNAVEATSSKFYFSLDGMGAIEGLQLGSVLIKRVDWDSGKLYAVDDAGTRYEVTNAAEPLIPLHFLIGTKYNGFYSPFRTYFPGTSQQGLDILRFYHDGLGNRATGYVFNYGEMALSWNLANKRVTLGGFSSQNGGSSGWTTNIVYDYILDEATGTYTFTLRSAASGGYTSVILQPMHNFLTSGSFKLSYHTENGTSYAKVTGVERPEVVMTFELY